VIGGRKGFRPAAVEELANLLDCGGSPALPAGHPFQNVVAGSYWTSTTRATSNPNAFHVDFSDGSLFTSGKDDEHPVWCARGGRGHDGKL